MHTYQLETKRLILRPLCIDDAAAVFAWASDPSVARYMVYNPYTSIADVEKWIRLAVQQEDVYEFGFVRKEDSLLIGTLTNSDLRR